MIKTKGVVKTLNDMKVEKGAIARVKSRPKSKPPTTPARKTAGTKDGPALTPPKELNLEHHELLKQKVRVVNDKACLRNLGRVGQVERATERTDPCGGESYVILSINEDGPKPRFFFERAENCQNVEFEGKTEPVKPFLDFRACSLQRRLLLVKQLEIGAGDACELIKGGQLIEAGTIRAGFCELEERFKDNQCILVPPYSELLLRERRGEPRLPDPSIETVTKRINDFINKLQETAAKPAPEAKPKAAPAPKAKGLAKPPAPEPEFELFEEAVAAAESCTKCTYKKDGSKGCKACMGHWFDIIRKRSAPSNFRHAVGLDSAE